MAPLDEHTHTLGRNLNGNLVPCLPTPRTKDKRRRRRRACTAAASKARLVSWPACTILFLLLHFGRSDTLTDRRASTAYVPAEHQSTENPLRLCLRFVALFVSLDFVILAFAWQARACRHRLGHVIFGLRRLFSCFFPRRVWRSNPSENALPRHKERPPT